MDLFEGFRKGLQEGCVCVSIPTVYVMLCAVPSSFGII